MKTKLYFLVLVGIALFISASFLVRAADPVSPQTLTLGPSSNFNVSGYSAQTADALAGNITAISMTSSSQTKAWAGFYGNITGTIKLDDAENYTFYDWSASEPRGQIYATLNSSIAWSTILCYNFTLVPDAEGNSNVDTIEWFYNISTQEVDGVNETFNDTNHPAFQVGSITMTGCPTTYVYQDDTSQRNNFINVLLYDNATNNATGWVYTTLIENRTPSSGNDLPCYNGVNCDFQILVNENGHGVNVAVTTYYFWVELL